MCVTSIPELEPRFFHLILLLAHVKNVMGLGTINEWPWDEGDPDAWKANYPDFFGDKYATVNTCTACNGKRLNKYALAVTIGGKNIYDLCDFSIKEIITIF